MTDPSEPNSPEKPHAVGAVEAEARSLAEGLSAAPREQTNILVVAAGAAAIIAGVALLIVRITTSPPPTQETAGTRTVPFQVQQPQAPIPRDAIALTCGDSELTPEFSREVVFTIPPGNCWTIWVVKPDRAANFWSDPDGDVWVKKLYADGTESAEILDNPLKRTVDPKPIVKRRYRNPGTNLVRVRILFQ